MIIYNNLIYLNYKLKYINILYITFVKKILKAITTKIFHFNRLKKLFKVLNITPDFFNNRSVVKTQGMTIAYCAGKTAFTSEFAKTIVSYKEDIGDSSINMKNVKDLASIITTILDPIMKQELPALYYFRKVMMDKVKKYNNKNPMIITNDYLTWYFDRVILRATQHAVEYEAPKAYAEHKISKRFQFAIYTNAVGRDLQAMRTSFSSIFIHGCDALIVYECLNAITQINNKCKEINLPIFLNHDNFGLPAYFSQLLHANVYYGYNRFSSQIKHYVPTNQHTRLNTGSYIFKARNPEGLRH